MSQNYKSLEFFGEWSNQSWEIFCFVKSLQKYWIGLKHLFIQLSVLLFNIRPAHATKLNLSKEPSLPSQIPIYPWVERSNYSEASCSGTKVSWPGFEPTLCWTETPELEFGALNYPLNQDTPHNIHVHRLAIRSLVHVYAPTCKGLLVTKRGTLFPESEGRVKNGEDISYLLY